MRLLLLISWPYFRKHLLRTFLTAAGILLGISVFVAMQAANQSALLAFSQTIDRLAGKTDLQVTAGEAGFGEDILEKIQNEPSVAVAVPIIEAVVETSLAEGGSLLVLGVDMTGDRSLRDYDVEGGDGAEIDDPLVFLAQPDSIMLSKEFAASAHLSTGDHITLGTAEGDRTFTVRGLMATRGMMSAFGGKLAIMDIYAAQKMFGRGRTFDRIDIGLKPDVQKADAQQTLQSLLGPGFDVQTPASRGQQAEAVLAGYTIMVRIASAFALFIAMFIIYNAFSTAVAQRRSEVGILRALGASRYQIAALFLAESALIGLLGSLAGIGLGVLVARAVAVMVGSLMGSLYGVAQEAQDIATSTGTLSLAFGLGLGTSIVAAVGPAFSAASVSPLEALRRGGYQQISVRAHFVRLGIAGLLAIGAAVCLIFQNNRQVAYLGYTLTVAAAVAGTPALSLVLAKALRPLASLVQPVEGALAADGLVQNPRRTAASVSALMLSLTLIIAFAGVARSSYQSIVEWMDAALNPDLFVMPSQRLDIRTTRFPADMAKEIAAIPGVDRVQMFRNNRITFGGSPAMIVAVEMASVGNTARRKTVAGDPETMYATAAEGRGAIVSDNLATLHHLTLGKDIEIAAPYRCAASPCCRHRRRLYGSAGIDSDRSKPVPEVLAGRYGK
ncbi:MAG: ABC transporter permease [Vicinamibacterales bacterium]